MEINLGSIKIDKAVTVTFYIFSLVLPLPFGLLILDFKAFESIDIFKLLLMSISITGCSVLIHFILTFCCFGLVRIATLISTKNKSAVTNPPGQFGIDAQPSDATSKENVDNVALPKSGDDLVVTPLINAAKSNGTTVGETALYLTFVLNNILSISVIGNLIRLKYYLHINPKYWIIASIDTYLFVSILWYSLCFLLVLISIRIIRKTMKSRKKFNKTFEDFLGTMIEFQKSQNAELPKENDTKEVLHNIQSTLKSS